MFFLTQFCSYFSNVDEFSGKRTAFTCGLFVLLLAGCATRPTVIEPLPLPPCPAPADVETYMQILSVTSPQVAPDSTLYYLTWTTGVDQVYRRQNNEVSSVTTKEQFPEGVDFFSLSPDGKHLVIGSDKGGTEQFDLYLIDTSLPNSPPKSVDTGETARADGIVWAENSQTFYYRSTRRNGKDFDFWSYELAKGRASLLEKREGYHWIEDISPDGRKLAYVHYKGAGLADLMILDLQSHESLLLTPSERERGMYHTARFTADSKHLFFLSDDGHERTVLGKMSASKPSTTWDVLAEPPWDIESFTLSPNRDFLAYAFNEHGASRLNIVDADTLEDFSQPDVETGVIENPVFSGFNLYFVLSSASKPGDVIRYDMITRELEQLTFSDTAGIDTKRFVAPELVFIPSFDGLKIPAFLYRPEGYSGRPAPYVVYAHGGPSSQFRPRFIRNFQHLLANGIGVIAPNVRGSSGYTSEYMALDDYRKRLDSIRDFKAAADWLVQTKLADPKRLAIKGGSYGGYVVMASLTEYPTRFMAGINSVGIVNFVTFLEQTKGYRRQVREMEYGPLSDREFLKSISPIHKIDRVVSPLMIVHGENDPRVPVNEARQIIDALRARGGEVESLIFPDEGHGIRKLSNRKVAYRRMADFLLKYLRPNPDKPQDCRDVSKVPMEKEQVQTSSQK